MLTSSNCDDCLSCLRNETPKRASTARNTYGNRGIRRKSLTIGTHMALMAKLSSEESKQHSSYHPLHPITLFSAF